MAYSGATLPLTGAGDATAAVAADVIGGLHYQAIKLIDGLEGSTEPVRGKGTTPAAADVGLVVRPIGSTAHIQGVILSSQHTFTVGNPTTAVTVDGMVGALATGTTSVNVANQPTVDLSTVGSTRLVGRVTVDNPSTVVELSSAGSSRQVGTVNQGTAAGSSADAWWVRTVSTQTGGAGSTTVDANLTSAGSTKLVGTVGISTSTGVIGAVSLTSAGTTATLGQVAVSNPTTAVDLSSAGSTRLVGTVNQGSPAASSADAWWVRTVTTGAAGAGSTTVDANLTSAGSTKLVGTWADIPFSSSTAHTVRTTANSSVDVSLLAANANRRAALFANNSTGTALLVSFTTAAVSSVGAYNFQVAALSFVSMGQGGLVPLYTGPIRGKMNSTLVAGPVFVTEFLTTA